MDSKTDEKKVLKVVKLEVRAGQATPAPPVGPALGQYGVNIGEFVHKLNSLTSLNSEQYGAIVMVVVTIYTDKSCTFVVKSPNTAFLLKQAAEVTRGSGCPNTEPVGSISRDQLRHIAEVKFPDLNAHTIEAAEKTIRGTARSMGIDIEE